MSRHREPGDDDDRAPDDVDVVVDAADDEALVPLGEVLAALDGARTGVAEETARDVLRATRTPPHAMDAERAVLGALLLEPTTFDEVVDTGLEAQDFYRRAHGVVFEAILVLRAAGEPVDTVTVVDMLQQHGQLEAVGGAAAISQLEAMLPTAAHAGAYARLVREKALLRRVIENATRLVTAAYAQNQPIGELLELSQAAFADLTVGRRDAIVDRSAVVREVMALIGQPGRRGLQTGWRDLDDGLLQRGLQPGNLIIVGARPAMGKTAFGHQLAAQVADYGVHSAFFSLEMTPHELIERELAAKSRVPASNWRLQLGTGRLQKAAGFLAERPLHLVHCPGSTLAQLSSIARRLVARGVSLIVVDYLGLVGDSGKYAGNRTQQVGEVSRGLKALAGQLMVPIVCLSQLNRAVETRSDKRPTLGDLRDTGDIEQDADAVMFVHRPEYYLKEKTPSDLQNIAEIIVEKQRNGPTGIARLWFEPEQTRFRTVEAADGGFR